MRKWHKLLERQLRKYWYGKYLSPEMETLLKAINDSYHHYDRDHVLLDRAMELSSKELMEVNRKLHEELQFKRFAEEKIREKDQILKSINENLREAVYRSSKERMIYVNQAFIELFGYGSEDEVLNTIPEQFYSDPKRRREVLETLETRGSVKSEEVLFRRKNGDRFWALLSSIASSDNEGNHFYDGAITDISTQKKNEENLRIANEQLKKINEELDRFVYSASHDLRSPLRSLLGLIHLFELPDSDPRELLEMMRTSILKLDNFIEEIIDYSRNARLSARVELIQFRELIEDSFTQFKYLPSAHQIEKIVELNGNVPFYSDRNRLQMVFNNLISNALTYFNPQANQSFIKVKVSTSTRAAVITISDNGIGIDEPHIEKIFDMFYRGTTYSTGSGLGLYIVKEVLEKLNGSIQVSSQKNHGTTFVVDIPNGMAM